MQGVFPARCIQTVTQLVGPRVKIFEFPDLDQIVAAVVEEHLLF